jgi:hypothetical protein
MSADNYIVVKKFGKSSFGWAMFFLSDDRNDKKANWRKGFKSPREAACDAEKQVDVIEYGITFDKGCLVGE